MPARRKGPAATLPIERVRQLALNAQGLGADLAPFGSGKSGTLRAVEHLGYVQIDTISVVQRAHHHVLWSRVPGYSPTHLHTLHADDCALFEYWSHAASYLPMRDFRYSRPLMRTYSNGRLHWSDPSPELDRAMRRIVARLRREGALQARDVVPEQTVSGGWGSFTKIERRALHELWMQGRVMISSRIGFEKVFDLPERVLPPDLDQRMPTPRQAALFRIRQAIRAHGIVREREILHLATADARREIRVGLEALLRTGEIIEIHVEGFPGIACYAFPEALASENSPLPPRVHILSPFDNLIIQRARLRWLFGFDYQLECYVPAAKRRVGYFVLPILVGDTFAARMDAVADRPTQTLRIKKLVLEPQVQTGLLTRVNLQQALQGFAAFNGCSDVHFEPEVARAVTNLLSS